MIDWPQPLLTRERLMTLGGFCGALLLSAVTAKLVVDPLFARLVFAGSVGALVLALGLRQPRRLIYVLLVWLPALGLVRRATSTFAPATTSDVYLLIEPLAIVLLVVAAAGRGAFRRLTPVSKGVFALIILIFLGAFNPTQGGVLTGVGGLIFLLVPVLMFWVGRGLVDSALLHRLLWVVAAIGVPVALYGLWQIFTGFPSWDQAYIDQNYATLVPVNGVVRPFGPFASPSEYAYYLAVGIVVWLSLALGRIWIGVAAGAVALLGTAAVYESSRGIIFVTIFATSLVVAAWRRFPLPLAAAGAAIAIVLIPVAAGKFALPASGADPRATLLNHQLTGLSDPLNQQSSTLTSHFQELTAGLASMRTHPIGYGSGTPTIAAGKFGGSSFGTEVDPSNIAVATGIPGFVAYIVVALLGFQLLYRLARRGERVAFAALAVFAVTTLQWFNGAQYSIALLPWLVLGWADARRQSLDDESHAAQPTQ